MSTGPEHYREAEQLLTEAFASTATNYEGENPEADRLIAAAQVHALLAQAPAPALPSGTDLADLFTDFLTTFKPEGAAYDWPFGVKVELAFHLAAQLDEHQSGGES